MKKEKELFSTRKEYFKLFVISEGRLPRAHEQKFPDGEDLRLWFDDLVKLSFFRDYCLEIKDILSNDSYSILTNKEREEEFLSFVVKYDYIPKRGEMYFSDDIDMYSWYLSYKTRHEEFETRVHELLSEYKDLDLSEIWFFVKEECFEIVKKLKRIPDHGEVITENGIDVRSIFDKLEKSDPTIYEEFLLLISSYKENHLSIDQRVSEFLSSVKRLGYIPYVQEARFSDGTDMYTWYKKYEEKVPGLKNSVLGLLENKIEKNKLNIYLIPNFRKNGGKFYTICTNVGEVIDLDGVATFDDLKEKNSSVVKRGGLILKKDEEIGNVSFIVKK